MIRRFLKQVSRVRNSDVEHYDKMRIEILQNSWLDFSRANSNGFDHFARNFVTRHIRCEPQNGNQTLLVARPFWVANDFTQNAQRRVAFFDSLSLDFILRNCRQQLFRMAHSRIKYFFLHVLHFLNESYSHYSFSILRDWTRIIHFLSLSLQCEEKER